jgi:ribosomal protein S18 acetylase RimI-like enzyme
MSETAMGRLHLIGSVVTFSPGVIAKEIPIARGVRGMTARDVKKVTSIHLEQFPSSRSTLLGSPFVQKMYRWFIAHQPDLSVVAVVDGQVAGFACGAIGGYGRRVFRYALPEVVWGLACHPQLLLKKETFGAWTSYAQAFIPHRKPAATAAAGSEIRRKASLASIAVSGMAQGKGVGKALMFGFEESAKHVGVKLLGLSVESNNLGARKLYESCGWVVLRENIQVGTTYYIKHITSISAPERMA